MRLNDFSVQVRGGKEIAGGYVEIQHGKNFKLQMHNFRNVACDAKVSIQGSEMGTWRIPALGKIEIERPEQEESKFTFYETNSAEGEMVGGVKNDPLNGLVQVTFTPAKVVTWQTTHIHHHYNDYYHDWYPSWPYRFPVWYDASGSSVLDSVPISVNYCLSGGSSSAASVPSTAENFEGTVGLAGHSDQQFVPVASLDYDLSQQTTISLRLIGTRKDIDTPHPLPSQANVVPPPLN